ncbi:MAG TPA: hypothetical protein VLL74_08030 [Methanoregula sp.]|nr:hypothetical protein [Methanoregula sp.]
MKLFRNPGLMIAVFWCAAMVIAPIAAAAGAGQNTYHGTERLPGSPAINPGSGTTDQGKSLNTAGPAGQGNRPGWSGNATAHNGLQGRDVVNMTGSGNRTRHAPGTGNLTVPPDLPAPGNVTDRLSCPELNSATEGCMTLHRPGSGNESSLPVLPDRYMDNSTATNQSRHGRMAGNITGPDQQLARSQQQEKADLIAELITWLKIHTGS